MKRKHQRLLFVLVGMGLLALAVTLVIAALGDSLNYFYAPSDLAADSGKPQPAGAFQLGGLVKEGSFTREGDLKVRFVVTDNAADIVVHYDQSQQGLLPDLFREGQGVIVEGSLQPDGSLMATRVLAKHDENYMPPEVADALKRSGDWRGDGTDAATP